MGISVKKLSLKPEDSQIQTLFYVIALNYLGIQISCGMIYYQ